MEKLKAIIREQKINSNKIPYKTVILSTGVVCEHYKNGKVEVIKNN